MRLVNQSECCPVCGRRTGEHVLCGACLSRRPPFCEGHYGYYFEHQVREVLHAFKFGGRIDAGRLLTSRIADRILAITALFDCIVPIPVSRKRLRERGFNQSFIIAEEIGHLLQKPLLFSTLIKSIHRVDQFSLPRAERRQNVKNVFSVSKPETITGKRVLLVDDLYTTGATVTEASTILLRHGAQSVMVFALARTPS